jgi:hypothetical protein
MNMLNMLIGRQVNKICGKQEETSGDDNNKGENVNEKQKNLEFSQKAKKGKRFRIKRCNHLKTKLSSHIQLRI